MTIADYAKQIPDELVGAIRSAMIATSVVGIILGIIALVWPKATLVVIGVLFGIALIVAGLFRLWQAIAARVLSTGWRVFLGLVGAVVLLVGIFAVFNPANALWFLAVFIGVGWIFQGVADLVAAVTGSAHSPRWLLILSGVISVIAGIVMLFLPSVALLTFLWVAAIMLIVISVVTLLTLPKKVDAQAL